MNDTVIFVLFLGAQFCALWIAYIAGEIKAVQMCIKVLDKRIEELGDE